MSRILDTITLIDERSQLSAIVSPGLGGMLTNLVLKGKEILYLDNNLFGSSDILTGGFPVLFPVCGSLNNGMYHIAGEAFQMPEHGFVRNSVWSVRGKDKSKDEVTLFLESSKDTLRYYPFDFNIYLTYKVAGNTLFVKMNVNNRSNIPMPFYAGYHPYFKVSDKKSISVDINADTYIDYYTGASYKVDGSLDFDKPIDFIYSGLKGNRHIIKNFRDNYELKAFLDNKTKNLVLWTMEEKPFICLEPWMAGPDAMNTGEELVLISPGETDTWKVEFEITII